MEQWVTWYEALNDAAFEPLYQAINSIVEQGQELSIQAYQESRASGRTINPDAFLITAFYPMLDELERYSGIDKEEMVKQLVQYQDLGEGVVAVDNQNIDEFLVKFGSSGMAFSAAAKNLGSSQAKRIKYTTNSEATQFEAWAKSSEMAALQIPNIILDIDNGLNTIFSAFDTLENNYGFLGESIEDVQFDDLEVDSSSLMFESRELPKPGPRQRVNPTGSSDQRQNGIEFKPVEVGFEVSNDESFAINPSEIYVSPGDELLASDFKLKEWVNN
ncbi:hypothetical protein ABW20_dc0101610 [Dactylellina cionopaga]|nr:hypothetical protein ABW20_dc0101610 [Dactylellina cionopaga]